MGPKPLSVKFLNRFVGSFLTQFTRRGLRGAGIPRAIIPVATGMVREFNRHMQWGNAAVWKQRKETAKQLFAEFQEKQKELSPVYRFRGGSSTVRPHLSQETIRDKYRDPSLVKPKLDSKIDSSSVIAGGLAFVVIASLAGPALAKKIHYVDPLDVRDSDIQGSSSSFDLKL